MRWKERSIEDSMRQGKFAYAEEGSKTWVSLSWLKEIIEEGMNSFKDTDADLSSLLCRIELEERGK